MGSLILLGGGPSGWLGLGFVGEVPRAHAAMVVAQLIIGGYNVVTTVALDTGVNQVVYCLFRDLIAISILAPVAFFTERRVRPPMTWSLLASFCVLGFTGTFANQLLFVLGLKYTNPSFAAAMQPSIPVFTFILVLIMRIETVNLFTTEGRLKVIGAIAGVSGAVLMVFYRGPPVFRDRNRDLAAQTMMTLTPQPERFGWLAFRLMQLGLAQWHIGVLCLMASNTCFSVYLTLQAPILKKYPASLSLTAYVYGFGVLFMTLTGLAASNSHEDWTLTGSGILAVLYAGIGTSALNYGLVSWSNKILGPALVAMYSPLQPVMVAIFSMIFLQRSIFLGSIVGGVMISCGLYLVTWAFLKEREATLISDLDDNSEPLLREDPPFVKTAGNISPGSSVLA